MKTSHDSVEKLEKRHKRRVFFPQCCEMCWKACSWLLQIHNRCCSCDGNINTGAQIFCPVPHERLSKCFTRLPFQLDKSEQCYIKYGWVANRCCTAALGWCIHREGSDRRWRALQAPICRVGGEQCEPSDPPLRTALWLVGSAAPTTDSLCGTPTALTSRCPWSQSSHHTWKSFPERITHTHTQDT